MGPWGFVWGAQVATQLRVQLEKENPALARCVCPCPLIARCVTGMTQRLEVDSTSQDQKKHTVAQGSQCPTVSMLNSAMKGCLRYRHCPAIQPQPSVGAVLWSNCFCQEISIEVWSYNRLTATAALKHHP